MEFEKLKMMSEIELRLYAAQEAVTVEATLLLVAHERPDLAEKLREATEMLKEVRLTMMREMFPRRQALGQAVGEAVGR